MATTPKGAIDPTETAILEANQRNLRAIAAIRKVPRDAIRESLRAFKAQSGALEWAAEESRDQVALQIGLASVGPIVDTPAWRKMLETAGSVFSPQGPVSRTMDSVIRRTIRAEERAGIRTSTRYHVGDYPGIHDVSQIASQWVLIEGARQVTAIDESTRRGIAELLAQAFDEDWTRAEAGRMLLTIRTLGLDRPRARTLAKLVAGWHKEQLPKPAIERMAEKKHRELLRERADVIGRTETQNAGNEGQRVLWEADARAGRIDTGEYVLVWTTRDPCPICTALQGTVAEIRGGEFQSRKIDWQTKSGRSRRMQSIRLRRPTAHPRCFCFMLRRLRSELDLFTDEEVQIGLAESIAAGAVAGAGAIG